MSRPCKPFYRPQKDCWYVRIDGKRQSLGVSGSSSVKAAHDAWHRLAATGRAAVLDRVLEPIRERSVSEVVSGFLADAAERVKPETLALYRSHLEPFAAKFGTLPAERLTAKQVESWARKPTWSPSTRHTVLGTLATCLKLKVKRPAKQSAGAASVIEPETFARMLANSTGDFAALLRFLWHTGCRPSEATRLTAESVDTKAECVTLREHKTAHTGKPRIIYLSADALAVILAQRERHPAGALFPNAVGGYWTKHTLVGRMKALSDKIGARVTAYGFRHSFATRGLAAGVPDAHVAELLGHVGTAMIHKHYSHLAAKSRTLRDALAKVGAA